MKKKIAIISEHASPLATIGGIDSGGQNVYVDQVAKNLAKLDYFVDVYTRWDNPKLPKVITYQNGVRIIHVEAGPKKFIPKEKMMVYMNAFYKDMLSFMKQENIWYDLLHANFFMSADVARKFKKNFGIPFVVTFHALGKVRRLYQGKEDEFPNTRFFIEQKVIKYADHIIAECPQDREDLISYYHADQNKIHIIPCGFDPNEFYPINKLLAKMTLQLETNTKYILQLGRMVPRKGVDTVIYALSYLLKNPTTTKVKLLVVGGESESPDPTKTVEIGRLQKLAKKLNIADHVLFFGRRNRDQLKYFYNAADIFVSTPWYEPFGITPIEAMACAVPVIGSQVGGIQFSVVHGKTGFLIPAKDSLALAEKIEKIITNEKLANLFSENAIKRVNAFFTWNTITQALSSVFEKIIYSHTTSVENYELLTNIVDANFTRFITAIHTSQKKLRFSITRASRLITNSLTRGGKILLCGNGGSASDAQHFAAEFIGQFKIKNRTPLPAISLTTDTSVVTAIGNDLSFNDIFSRQIEAYGQEGDILFAISTSGNSENIIQALKMANKKGMICIGLTGKKGGNMIDYCDISLIVPSENTQHIQEIHTHIIHSVCELVEKQLFAPLQTKEKELSELPIKQKRKLIYNEVLKNA